MAKKMRLLFLLIASILLISCRQNINKMSDDSIVYYQKHINESCELWIGKKKVNLNGIYANLVLMDSCTKRIWVVSRNKMNAEFDLYSVNDANIAKDKISIHSKNKIIEVFVYNNQLLCLTSNNVYKIFELDKGKLIKEVCLPKTISPYSLSGFDGTNVFFDSGYYSLYSEALCPYQCKKIFHNKICPEEKLIVYKNSKSGLIGLYDYASGERTEFNISAKDNWYSYQMYVLDGTSLFYAKKAITIRNFCSPFFPGAWEDLKWYKYDIDSHEISEVKLTHNGNTVILGFAETFSLSVEADE